MKDKICNLCGKKVEENQFFYFNENKICYECAERIKAINTIDVYRDGLKDKPGMAEGDMPAHSFRGADNEKDMRPLAISKKLSEYVVGQENAKKILSVAAYNHYKRTCLRDPGLQKSNVLLIGPTGSGKTYLVKTLAKILDVPFAIVPATNLTETGYVGKDVDSIIQSLYDMAGSDPAKAERGIVFIDEIDKLAGHTSRKREVGAQGVQQALLPIIEGCMVDVAAGSDGFASVKTETHKVPIDTTNILFICGGAFPEVEEIIKNRKGIKAGGGVGFQSASQEEEVSDIDEDIMSYVTNEDLKEFGIIPELLGRLPVIASLQKLSIELLKRVLSEPKDCLVSQYKKYFKFDGIELEFQDEALEAIAEKASEVGTGARSLRTITENALMDLMYYTPSQDSVRKIVVTKDFIEGKGNPEFVN